MFLERSREENSFACQMEEFLSSKISEMVAEISDCGPEMHSDWKDAMSIKDWAMESSFFSSQSRGTGTDCGVAWTLG